MTDLSRTGCISSVEISLIVSSLERLRTIRSVSAVCASRTAAVLHSSCALVVSLERVLSVSALFAAAMSFKAS